MSNLIIIKIFKFTVAFTAKHEELKKKKIERPVEPKKTPAKSSDNGKEAEMTEEEKAKQRSKPISSTAVPGTPWCVVWTRDRRVFFYNPSEKTSVWERPLVLTGRGDVDKLVKEPPGGAETSSSGSVAPTAAVQSTNVSNLTSSVTNTNNTNVNNNNSSGSLKKKTGENIGNAAEPPLKKHK